MRALAGWARIASGAAHLPTSVKLGLAVQFLDAFVLVAAVADIVGLDMSGAGITLLGSTYVFDAPGFPWIAGGLSALSLVACWFGGQGRRLVLVMVISTAWVAFAAAILASGSGPGLLIWKLGIVALLYVGRRGFST